MAGYTSTFSVNEHRFKLTAGKAGVLLDKMIERQKDKQKYGYMDELTIKFSKKDRNLFKGLQWLTDKNKNVDDFFRDIIKLHRDDHNKIIKAEFNPIVFINPD